MKTIYIAYDGKEFDNENDCLHYEEECKKKDLNDYYNLPRIHFTFDDILIGASDEVGYDIVYIRDKKDLEVLNKAVELKNGCIFKGYGSLSTFDESYIGKNVALATDFEDNLIFYKNEPTFEAIKTRIEDTLNSIANMLKAFKK